jgi:hypothetical protein
MTSRPFDADEGTRGDAPVVDLDTTELSDGSFLVRFRQGEDTVEVTIRLPDGGLDNLLPYGATATDLVRATMHILLERQLGIDLPPFIDVDDLVAAYDDYPAQLSEKLTQRSSRAS